MLKTVSDLISAWPAPSVANFGRDIGVTVEHAAAMKRRNSVPVKYWEPVVEKAKARRISGISYTALVALHSDKGAAA